MLDISPSRLPPGMHPCNYRRSGVSHACNLSQRQAVGILLVCLIHMPNAGGIRSLCDKKPQPCHVSSNAWLGQALAVSARLGGRLPPRQRSTPLRSRERVFAPYTCVGYVRDYRCFCVSPTIHNIQKPSYRLRHVAVPRHLSVWHFHHSPFEIALLLASQPDSIKQGRYYRRSESTQKDAARSGVCAMKKVTLAIAITMLAASSVSYAADLPMKAPPPAPLPPPFSWTGFYIGGNIGGAWGQRHVNDGLFGFDFSNTSDGVFIGGGQVGFNYQTGGFVIGIEGDFDWANNSDNNNGGVLVPGVGLIRVSANDKWITTVAARLGFTFGQALFYGK